MTDAIRFLHLTDLHLSEPALHDTDLLTDTLATLRAVLGQVTTLDPAPAFVLVSGDLTNRGDEGSYRLLRRLLAAIEVPVLLALGNHDARAPFRRIMLDQTAMLEAPYVHDRLVGGAHVIVLDSLVPGRIAGALDEGQFAFLEAALARHPDVPKLVMLHHPPALDPEAVQRWHALNWDGSQRLAAMLAGRDVAGLFCGHVHVARISMWHGIPVVVGPGQHNLIDPFVAGQMRMTTGGGLALCTLRASGLTVEYGAIPGRERELGRLPAARVESFE